MKKIGIVLGLASIAVFMSSCKKDYTCECVTSLNGTEYNRAEETRNLTKKDAEEWCSGENGTTTTWGITYDVSCELK